MTRKPPEFYQDGETYVALTGESPRDFKDCLFLAYTGKDSGSINETCVSRDNLDSMTRVEGADVPDDWAKAFEAKGVDVPRQVATADVTCAISEIEPVKPYNSQETTELFHGHLASGCDMFTAAAASDYHFGDEPGIIHNFTTRDLFWIVVVVWIVSIWMLGVIN